MFERKDVKMNIRFASISDSAALLDIYGQYIDTPVTFECRLPTEEEFAARVAGISREYPYLVCEDGGRVVGYAYAHRQKEREAYQWNAELSVYLDRSYTSKGIGRTLYSALMELLALQGIKTVYGVVTQPNEKSEGLHESLGFGDAGIHHCTGYKCGRWHDVRWFEKQIAPYEEEPAPIRSIGEIPWEELEAVLQKYGRILG